MLPAVWVVIVVAVAVLLSMWVTFTLTRLDRLHARVDAARAALDAQLVRRAAALMHVAEASDTGLNTAERAGYEAAAEAALSATGVRRREGVENAVGRAVLELTKGPAVLGAEAAAELREAAARVQVARRFYNDAVRHEDTQGTSHAASVAISRSRGPAAVLRHRRHGAARRPARSLSRKGNRKRMTTRKNRASRLVVTTTVALALLASACTGSSGKHDAAPSVNDSPKAPMTSASSTAAAKPKPKPKPAINPFTGIGPVPRHPTIIAKIDDTAPGRPQVGIDKADIVFIEEAEGGLSRLAAVFSTYDPTIGYIRSTRPSDPDLFLEFGKITEAASGGGGDSLPRLRASGIKGWINDWGAAYYHRVPRYQSTYINLALNLGEVAKHVKTPGPRDIGFRFSAKPIVAGKPGTDVRTMVGGTPVEFRWAKALHKYIRYINGQQQHAADGHLVTASNVIVQTCKIIPHYADRDVLGNPSQFTFTTGRGPVSIFRNGIRIDGYWARGSLNSGTRFATASHHLITLSPGTTWIALVRSKAHTTGS